MTREQARKYIDAVSRMHDAPPCVYGHFGCALMDGGPCSDELHGQHKLDDGGEEGSQ